MTIPNTLSIHKYFNCGKCMDELPEGQSPQDYKRLDVGFTDLGLQVWCIRHDCNVVHINFDLMTMNSTIPVDVPVSVYQLKEN